MDKNYIYYANGHVDRVDKKGENEESLTQTWREGFINGFTQLKLRNGSIFAFNRVFPNQIWAMRSDGSNLRLIVEAEGMKDGYVVSENAIYYSLEDGIYRVSFDGSKTSRILIGDYDILCLVDNDLYYKNNSDSFDYTELSIKVD